MDKKYTIFISSTYEDLKEAREEVMKAVLTLRHIPLGMEIFGASSVDAWKFITKQIDQADYYLVIIGEKYGSTDIDGKSFTEKEYDYAVSKGIPSLSFIHNESGKLKTSDIERDPIKLEALKNFKKKLSNSHLFDKWSTVKELGGKVALSLSNVFTDQPRAGWIQDKYNDREELLNRINELTKKNEELGNRLKEQSNDISKNITKTALTLGHTTLIIEIKDTRDSEIQTYRYPMIDYFLNLYEALSIQKNVNVLFYVNKMLSENGVWEGEDFDGEPLQKLHKIYVEIKNNDDIKTISLSKFIIGFDLLEPNVVTADEDLSLFTRNTKPTIYKPTILGKKIYKYLIRSSVIFEIN